MEEGNQRKEKEDFKRTKIFSGFWLIYFSEVKLEQAMVVGADGQKAEEWLELPNGISFFWSSSQRFPCGFSFCFLFLFPISLFFHFSFSVFSFRLLSLFSLFCFLIFSFRLCLLFCKRRLSSHLRKFN